ncbi:DUF362 domain-containing protein [Candidatus Aminicenantes bacterium AC-334-K16]|nr:DUF362 domain-containing protein [Candidatus Aminicenantes bacterium AC-334-K16]
MKRRAFIKDLAWGSLVFSLHPWSFAQSTSSGPQVAFVQGDSPGQLVTTAISLLGGMSKFISRGDVVVVKPNIGWDRTPQQAACTNPEVVATVVKLTLEAGAKEVKVLDNPCNPARRTYARSGIAKAAKAAGAKVFFPNPHRLKKIPLHGEWLKEWEVYTDFIEADKIINVPIAKHHSLSRLTMGMKNWLGALGGNRNQLHQKLDQAMVDLASFFKPALTILDAYRILWRNGPQGGRLSDVKLAKTLIASQDYVAVDALGATLFEIKPDELPFLQIAYQKGQGEIYREKMNIVEKKI